MPTLGRRNDPPRGARGIAIAHLEPTRRAAIVRAVAHAPRFAGAVLPGPRPVVCVAIAPSIRISDFDGLTAIAWGWDLTFGGVLTITPFAKHAGWLGRASICRTDTAFNDLQRGEVTLAFVASGRVIAAFDMDLADLPVDYIEQWTRVRDHVPVLDDPLAAYWEAITQHAMVVERRIQPKERLALGWVKRYAQAVNDLAWAIEHSPGDVAARAAARLAGEKEPFANELLRAIVERGFTVSALASWIHELRASADDKFVQFILANREVHDALHAVGGDDTPLCTLHSRLIDIELLAPHTTDEGQTLNWLSKLSGRFERLQLEPTQFPHGVPPEAYWPRITEPTSWNWGALISGSDVPADLTRGSNLWGALPLAEDAQKAEAAADALLAEAVASKKWTIPPRAELELPVGPFKRITASEVENEVFFVLRMESGEFAIAGIEPLSADLNFSGGVGRTEEQDARAKAALKLLLAAVVRDFFVVEDRETVFAHRREAQPRLKKGAEAEEPRIVYLPRVRYIQTSDLDRCARDLPFAERRRHEVGAHLRKAAHASDHQVWLARTYGFAVPAGYTFVRPHERGDRSRDVLYRSRSALAALYEATPAPPSAQEGEAPWFQFERDVVALLQSLDFLVEHVAAGGRGDGGVDVYATKGTDLDIVQWIVQCKRYAPTRAVGPSVIRELVGTLAEYPRGTRGMVVTTSYFSSDAQVAAVKSAVRLMDGEEFSSRVRACASKI